MTPVRRGLIMRAEPDVVRRQIELRCRPCNAEQTAKSLNH